MLLAVSVRYISEYPFLDSLFATTCIKTPQTFSSFLPSPSLTCCAILHTYFKAMTGRIAFIDCLLTVSRCFPSCKINARRSVHSPGIVSLSPLSLADRRDTRGKWSLAKKPDRSLWHRYTSLKLFGISSPWITETMCIKYFEKKST